MNRKKLIKKFLEDNGFDNRPYLTNLKDPVTGENKIQLVNYHKGLTRRFLSLTHDEFFKEFAEFVKGVVTGEFLSPKANLEKFKSEAVQVETATKFKL